jgi:carboxyl-terminal processing protease
MTSRFKAVFVTMSTCLVAVLLVGAVLGKSPASDDNAAYRHLTVYTEVLSRIKSDYVEEPDLKSVTLGALNGLLESVDPYASYLNADQYKEYLRNHDTYKGGIGLVLSKRFGYVGVVDAVPGSPAAKAGLTTGDMLETIKGISTRDMPLAYAELLLKGKPGTPIELTVVGVRHPEPKKISLTRALNQYPSPTTLMMPDKIGYLRAESMTPGKAKELQSALSDLQREGPQKLVLDLRHCGAGSVEEGITAANLFLDRGLITYVQGQKFPRQNFEADPAKAMTKIPMVVITNRGTASGCEVMAAALLDNKRAEVVGERTYGDASIRQPIGMDDGGAIILSVAKYYSPSGKAIQDVGVTPTVQVIESEAPVSDDDEDQPRAAPPVPAPSKPGEDVLLNKAIEVLKTGAPVSADTKPSQPKEHPVTAAPSTPLSIPAPPPK